MAIIPPVGPSSPPDREGEGQDPDFYYVTHRDATEEDRVTVLDKMAMVAAYGLAQLIRLFIIFAAIGLIILVIFILQHV